jgi:hypothetical protein
MKVFLTLHGCKNSRTGQRGAAGASLMRLKDHECRWGVRDLTRTKMTPKQRVLKKYPDAFCDRSGAHFYIAGKTGALTYRWPSPVVAWRNAWAEVRTMTRRACVKAYG